MAKRKAAKTKTAKRAEPRASRKKSPQVKGCNSEVEAKRAELAKENASRHAAFIKSGLRQGPPHPLRRSDEAMSILAGFHAAATREIPVNDEAAKEFKRYGALFLWQVTCHAVRRLHDAMEKEPELFRDIAETQFTWPIFCSPNSDIESRTKNNLKQIHFAEKSPFNLNSQWENDFVKYAWDTWLDLIRFPPDGWIAEPHLIESKDGYEPISNELAFDEIWRQQGHLIEAVPQLVRHDCRKASRTKDQFRGAFLRLAKRPVFWKRKS